MLFETEAVTTLSALTLSRRVESMPSLAIEPDGPLGEAFLAKGCIDFHDAVRLVRDLPWGKPTRPEALAVIEEGKGTATDKHFLLASLARELGNDELQLVLGIYRMSAETHPAAKAVLGKANLQSLPESLVWLRWYGGDYDFSSMRAGGKAVVVLQEETITLDKLPGYVEQRHKDFLVRFLLSSRRDDLPDLKGLWKLRGEALDAVIAEQEEHRKLELQRALDIATAQEQARERALTDAERSAEEAQNEIRERAAAEAERRVQYEAAEAERKAKAADREKARLARGEAETTATGRRRTRRAPGQRSAPDVVEEEIPEEEASVRRTTRKAPKSKLAEEETSAPTSRKRTRRAPGSAPKEEAAASEEAPASTPAPAPAQPRKRTRRAPGAKAAAASAPEASAAEPAPAAPTEEPAAAPRRKATRKAPGARRPAAGKADAPGEAAETPKAKAAPKAKEEPKPAEEPAAAPKRKRTRRAPGTKK